jgi:hypothetical protein
MVSPTTRVDSVLDGQSSTSLAAGGRSGKGIGLTGGEVSNVNVRRPMTGVAHASV